MVKRLNLQTPDDLNNPIEQPDILVKSKLCLHMERGLDLETAAKVCGISAYMLSVYRSNPEFEDFVQECEARCEDTNLENIKDAGDGGIWGASAWILERKFPGKYAKKDSVRHDYDNKYNILLQLFLTVVNSLEPILRLTFIHQLQALDVDGEIINLQQNNLLEYNLNSSKKKVVG
jgi:hypothetical protein